MQNPEIVPPQRRDAVRAALQTTFGAAPARAFHPIGGGVSGALIFRFDVRARSYLLRLEPERIALADRQRGYDCMAAAAEVGAAPPVHYVDAESGVAIMDFIQARPLGEHPGGPLGVARALGTLTAKVRSTPPFPMLGDYPVFIAEMLERLRPTPALTTGEFDACADGLARVRAALRWDSAALVSSHNDPNPRNLLFDGARLWLVDWELAFRNDPLVDVAILTTELAHALDQQVALLDAAFGSAPTAATMARLEVIRSLTRLFYGCIVLESLGGAARRPPTTPPLSPSAFRKAVAKGLVASGTPQTAYEFARMSLAAFVGDVSVPAFGAALRRAGEN